MDNYEFNDNAEQNGDFSAGSDQGNTYRPPEPVDSASVDAKQQPHSSAAPVRRESPFANSPYVTVVAGEESDEAPAQEPRPVYSEPEIRPEPARRPPEPPKPQEPRESRPLLPLLSMLLAAGALVLVLVTFLITNGRISSMKEQYEKQLLAYSEKLERLEEEQPAVNDPGSTGQSKPQVDETPEADGTPSLTGTLTPAQVYAQCVDSVVAINCTGAVNSGFGQIMETSSSGSGFILSEDGYIVTNFHVVEGQQKLEVSTNDGTTYEAEYIGGNEANDIALIKVDAEGLPPVTVGTSSDLTVGDQVAAIGNPLGELASTLTVGYISAKDRIVTSDGAQINMLQTDAAINPGNSGGPLFNMYGEVVGITSAKYSGTTDSGASIEGIGFAIPMDDVMNMLDDLRNYGYITGGYLGVSVSEVGEEASELYGLPKGVLVREVTRGSCAEKAGIQVQDIIVSLAGYDIESLNDLSRALNKCKGGEEVTVTVYRSGGEKTLSVVLDERPQETEPETTEPVSNEQYAPWPGNDFMDDWFGNFFG